MKARVFKTISIICLLLVAVFSFALAINKNDKTYADSTLIYQVDFNDSNDYGKNVASNLQGASFVNNGGVSFVNDSFLNKTAVQLTSTGVRQNYIKLPSDIFNGKTSVTISYHLKVSSTLPVFSRELEYGNGTNEYGNVTNRMVYMPFHLANYLGYRIEKNGEEYALAGTDTSVQGKTEGKTNLPNVGTILPLYNGWVLRSYVLTNTYFAVYQNGTEILRKEGDFTASQFYGASGYVYLGATDMDNTADFSGSFADIRVYDGILTPKEVEKQYGTTYKNYITDKWDFENENANNSIREYNGTLVGNAAVEKVDGKGVLSLDGTNSDDMLARTSMTVHPGFITGHREMSISIDLKISSNISSYARIFEFAVDKTTYMALYAGFGEKANVRFEFTKDANSTREILTKANYTLPLDKWINVTITLGLNNAVLYVDGVPIVSQQDFKFNDGIYWDRQTDNLTLTSWPGYGVMSFGKTSHYNDNPIIADYDCIEIYSKALTEQEILDSLGKIEYIENVDEYNEKYVDFLNIDYETYGSTENSNTIESNKLIMHASSQESKYIITEREVSNNLFVSVDMVATTSGGGIDSGIYLYAKNPSATIDGINSYEINVKRGQGTGGLTHISLYRFDNQFRCVEETDITNNDEIINLKVRVYEQYVLIYINDNHVFTAKFDLAISGGYIGLRSMHCEVEFSNMLIKANEFDINYSYLEDALSDTPLDKSLYTQASWEEYYAVYNLTNNVYQNKTATSQTNVKELANEYLLAKAKLDLKSSHNFNVSWSYDEYEHWHNCDDADCDVYDEKISHIYDNALDNECNDCGYIREIVINNSASLTLTGDIGVNLYIDVLKYTNDSNAYVELTYNHNSVGYRQQILTDRIDIKDLTHEDDYTYKFTVNYASGQINDKIFLTLFDSNGEELYSITDYYKNGYSIKEYCDRIISDGSQPLELRNLCQSIINYGVRAIDYFGYDANLENPTSSYIETIDGAPTEISSVPQTTITEGAKNLTLNRFSLVALSETSIRVYFDTSGFIFDSAYTIECSREYKTGYNDYGYYVEVYGIESTKIDELFTITIYFNGDEENKTIIIYSALNYISEKMQDVNSSDTLKELCLAIYQYNICAKQYFNDGENGFYSEIGDLTIQGGSIVVGEKDMQIVSDGADALAFSNVVAKNVEYSADIKMGASGAGALLIRADGTSDNFYCINIDKNANVVKFWKKVDGQTTIIAERVVSINEGEFYNLKVVALSANIKAYLNGALLIDVYDYALTEGKLGLNVYQTNATFNNIKYTILNAEESNLDILGGTTTKVYASTSINNGVIDFNNIGTLNALAIGETTASNLTISANIAVGGEGAGAIVFRYQDQNNYYSANVDTMVNVVKLWKMVNGEDVVITQYPLTVIKGEFYNIKAVVNGASIKIYLNNSLVLEALDSDFITGKVGLNTWVTDCYFKDIVIEQGANGYSYFSQVTTQNATLTENSGTFTLDNQNGGDAFAVGSASCNNFTISGDISLNGVGAGSFIIRYQDQNNFYCVNIDNSGANGVVKVWKMVGGTSQIITEFATTINANTFYNLKITIIGESITVYLNDTQVISCTDNSISNGKIGLNSWNTDIVVKNIKCS